MLGQHLKLSVTYPCPVYTLYQYPRMRLGFIMWFQALIYPCLKLFMTFYATDLHILCSCIYIYIFIYLFIFIFIYIYICIYLHMHCDFQIFDGRTIICGCQAHAWQPKAAPPKAAPPKVTVKARLPEEPHSENSWSIAQLWVTFNHIRDQYDMWEPVWRC